jgi:hypothetical protein
VDVEERTIPSKIRLDDLPDDAPVEVQTESRTYTLRKLRDGYVLLSGHPKHCPDPIIARLCRQPDSATDIWISEGARLKYLHPDGGVIRTSSIRRIRPASAKRPPSHSTARPSYQRITSR